MGLRWDGFVETFTGFTESGAVEIKAGLMKRQLSSNNAMDQGKAAEQVFFIYIYSRSMAGIVLRYF